MALSARSGALSSSRFLRGLVIDISTNAIGADIERQHETRVMNWLHAGYNVGLALGAGLRTFAFVLDRSYRSIFVALAVILGTLALARLLPLPIPVSGGPGPSGASRRRRPASRLDVISVPAAFLLAAVVMARGGDNA